MELNPQSGSDLLQKVEFNATAAEMELAFAAPMAPATRDIFTQRFSPEWKALKISEQLLVLSKIAGLIETAQAAQEAKAAKEASSVVVKV